jgi:hypothetical protein
MRTGLSAYREHLSVKISKKSNKSKRYYRQRRAALVDERFIGCECSNCQHGFSKKYLFFPFGQISWI